MPQSSRTPRRRAKPTKANARTKPKPAAQPKSKKSKSKTKTQPKSKSKSKSQPKSQSQSKTQPKSKSKSQPKSKSQSKTRPKSKSQPNTPVQTRSKPRASTRPEPKRVAVPNKASSTAPSRSRVRHTAKAKTNAKLEPTRSKAPPVARPAKRAAGRALARVSSPATTADAAHVRGDSRTRSDWRTDLRAAVAATGPDFAAYLTGLGLTGLTDEPPWEYADMPELIGLEQWGTELAKHGRRAGIGALVRVAQHGLPIAVERGGIGIEGLGFRASEPAVDGAPVETQIALAAAWLDAPDRTHLVAVAASMDRTRQLQIWDDDLIPNDDRAHWWYLEVGQCCTHAITRTGGSASGASYYEWPPEVCVGRGLVIAARGLRYTRASIGQVLADLRDAMLR
jgi:hypothetical protein